jgi:hypothetical protein
MFRLERKAIDITPQITAGVECQRAHILCNEAAARRQLLPVPTVPASTVWDPGPPPLSHWLGRYSHDNDSTHRRPDIAKRTANRGHVCVPRQRDCDGFLLLGGWPDHGGVRLELKPQALVDCLELFLGEFELLGQKFDLAILGLLDNLQFLSRSVAFADQSPVVLDHRFPAGDVKFLVARSGLASHIRDALTGRYCAYRYGERRAEERKRPTPRRKLRSRYLWVVRIGMVSVNQPQPRSVGRVSLSPATHRRTALDPVLDRLDRMSQSPCDCVGPVHPLWL